MDSANNNQELKIIFENQARTINYSKIQIFNEITHNYIIFRAWRFTIEPNCLIVKATGIDLLGILKCCKKYQKDYEEINFEQNNTFI